MRSKRIVALALLSISLLSVGCGKKESAGAKDSATPSSVESSTTLAETSKTAEAAQDTLEGVVLDASMNGFTLQNKEHGLIYVETGEDAAEKPDLSKLKNGFTAGEGVKLLGKMDGQNFSLSAAADQATALGDTEVHGGADFHRRLYKLRLALRSPELTGGGRQSGRLYGRRKAEFDFHKDGRGL